MMRRAPRYYRLIGRVAVPTDLLGWAEWFETAGEERQVEVTEIGPLAVSTVFVGVDMSLPIAGDRDPLLFESMIFGDSEAAGERRRYATWDEAERGHAELVASCRERLAAAQRLLQ